jgi:hypothetical protein
MSLLRTLSFGLLSLIAVSAWAGNPVIVKTDAPKADSTSTLNLQTSQGSACSAPNVGNCGSCSISCPTGKAAMCKAGMAVGGGSEASCLNPPECKCQ